MPQGPRSGGTDPANAARLARALAEFGYEVLALQAESHFATSERMATLGRPPVAIDTLSSSTGISFRAACAGRQKLMIGEHEVSFLGLKEFVATKRACGRHVEAAAVLSRLSSLDDQAVLRLASIRHVRYDREAKPMRDGPAAGALPNRRATREPTRSR